MEFTSEQKVMLARRRIYILTRINDDVQQFIISAILYLNALDSKAVITLYIDSRGGLIPAHFHIIDTIINSKAPIHGVVVGRAGSAAFNILQVCRVRMSYARADLMLHAPDLGGVRVDDMQTVLRVVEESIEYHRKFITYLSKRSSQPREDWVKWSKEERYFTGIEAKQLGIVDEVITPADGPWKE